MTKYYRAVTFFALTALVSRPMVASGAPIRLDSPTGFSLLRGTDHHHALALLTNYETQANTSSCGIASAVMVLNSLALEAPVTLLPRPFRYFTQTNFFRTEVTDIVTEAQVQRRGFHIDELAAAIASWGPTTTVLTADEMEFNTFRQPLIAALDDGDFIIANYSRAVLNQRGTGHHSPLAAYNAETDQFLLLDVARYAYPALWVNAWQLWEAVRAPDGRGRGRGALIVHSNNAYKHGLERGQRQLSFGDGA